MTVRRRPSLPAALASAAASLPGQVLLGLLFLAAIAMLALPAARGASASVGLLPLWLPGMPLAGLLALAAARSVESRAPRRRGPVASAPPQQRRRPAMAQARRRSDSPAPARLPRAA